MSTRNEIVRSAPVSLPALLTEKEVSELTRIPVRTLQGWRRNPPRHGGIPFTRVGGRVLYRMDRIESWLDEKTEDHRG